MVKAVEKVCGRGKFGSGDRKEREEWWWNEDVQNVIKTKKKRKEMELYPSPSTRLAFN